MMHVQQAGSGHVSARTAHGHGLSRVCTCMSHCPSCTCTRPTTTWLPGTQAYSLRVQACGRRTRRRLCWHQVCGSHCASAYACRSAVQSRSRAHGAPSPHPQLSPPPLQATGSWAVAAPPAATSPHPLQPLPLRPRRHGLAWRREALTWSRQRTQATHAARRRCRAERAPCAQTQGCAR
jgi:hypothetical protein